MSLTIEQTQFLPEPLIAGQPGALHVDFAVSAGPVFDLDCAVEIFAGDAPDPCHSRNLRADAIDVSWLPDGQYRVSWSVAELTLAAGLRSHSASKAPISDGLCASRAVSPYQATRRRPR